MDRVLPPELVDVILDFHPTVFRKINRRFLDRYKEQYDFHAGSEPISDWEYDNYLVRMKPRYTGFYCFNSERSIFYCGILLEKKDDHWEIDYATSVNVSSFRGRRLTHPKDMELTHPKDMEFAHPKDICSQDKNRNDKVYMPDPAVFFHASINRGCDPKRCVDRIREMVSSRGFPSAFTFMEKCFLGTESDDPRGAILKYLETLG